MQRITLRLKILLYSAALLIVLIAAMLAFVNEQAERFVDERLQTEIGQGRERIAAAEQQRLEGLRAEAGLVASFPELKALLATDPGTVRDFLLAYQQKTGGRNFLSFWALEAVLSLARMQPKPDRFRTASGWCSLPPDSREELYGPKVVTITRQ